MTEPVEILLGACPFCRGDVTVGVDEYDSETGMVYFSYDDRPRCENGCPVGRIDYQRCCFDDIRVTVEKDAAPVFRECWKKEVEALRNRPACPDCGKRAEFKSDGKDFPILGCSHCRLWAGEASTIAGLVDEWGKLADEKRKENERKGRSAGLADMLNELDGSHS